MFLVMQRRWILRNQSKRKTGMSVIKKRQRRRRKKDYEECKEGILEGKEKQLEYCAGVCA